MEQYYRLLFAVSVIALTATSAVAQSIPETAAALPRDDPEYETDATRIGPLTLTAGAITRLYYDDNVFATESDTVDDGVVEFSPYAQLGYESGAFRVTAGTQTRLRRHLTTTRLNSDASRSYVDLVWSPGPAENLGVTAVYERAVEERGDPEARASSLVGPRLLNIWSIDGRYRRTRGSILLDVRADISRYDALASFDSDRDYRSYGGQGTIGTRIVGSAFVTATGFANRQEFRLAATPAGIQRDSTTWGGRLGVAMLPGGIVEGNASAGFFRFEPDDPSLDARTGLSLAANLIYRPRRRTAIILSVTQGNEASFQLPASARTDLVARLTLQQEIRHNLYSSLTAGYRNSNFIGSDQSEDTVVGRGELEFVATRNLSLVVEVSYGERHSDIPLFDFDRIRGGIGVRMKF